VQKWEIGVKGTRPVAQSEESGWGLAVLAAVGFYFFAPAGWVNAVWYSVEYKVGPGEVHTDAKPSDCDFMHAPLGDKGCSYKAHVKAYNASGVLVGGEDSPKFGHDTKTGRPIISYDGGTTWDWYPADYPDLKAASVAVFWRKE
jgi:hypothetical protein